MLIIVYIVKVEMEKESVCNVKQVMEEMKQVLFVQNVRMVHMLPPFGLLIILVLVYPAETSVSVMLSRGNELTAVREFFILVWKGGGTPWNLKSVLQYGIS